ncbi:methyl-accepting chemotaxis protein [Cellvibrio sp. KY-GH-1]|uniref:methyl-accepting chemotaxis protein n=1 Tax=Cellvibrio sp. KY-GH-1 TaxID=2303332 RepID=UPI001245EA7B|nr:methyl-accepting chemotaxis protein [Cellvibrio sp. KY-GH-1]QEY15259.1 methyl-accepting chemotaxis protein [Cellvibrio sp. KY-GH-1]
MNWFYGLNIRTKLLIPISLISFLVVLMGVIAIERFRMVDKNVSELGEINLLAVGYLLEADTELHKALVEERSMLFLNAGTPDFIASIARHKQSITNARQKLGDFYGLVNGPAVDPVYKDYEKARDKWEALTLTVAREREANTRIGRTTAMEVSFKDANLAFADMRNIIYALKTQVEQKAAQAVVDSRTTVRNSRSLLVAIIVVTLFISFAIWLFTPRLMIDPIRKMIAFVTSLAGEGGDLTHKIPVAYHDELGELSQSINLFIDSLRKLLVRVIDVGQLFNSQAQMLTNLANTNSELSHKQGSEVSLVANAMNQLSIAIQEVAGLANSAAAKTNQVRVYSSDGLQVVGKTVDSINHLAEEVKRSASVIVELNQNSGNIASVVNVIKGIAEQINLLALNAAIEAARAGEQGRGFAVVADSVRELAFKTAESTKEIQSMITALQQSATQAVTAMDKSQKIAEDSVAQAGLAGAALEKIDSAVVEMSDLNTQIAQASQQQSRVSDEVTNNADNITRYTQDATQLTGQVDHSSQQLAEVAKTLQDELHKFKV